MISAKHITEKNKQRGGSIFYNPFIKSHKFLKLKYDENTKDMKYENLVASANNFTDEQQKDIDALVNFVLPFIVIPGTTNILGPNIIKNLEVVGAGSYGITLAYEGLLIKILKLDDNKAFEIINEINISSLLFRDGDGNEYANIPKSINKIHGLITGNPVLWNTVRGKYTLDKELENLRLYNNIGKTWLDHKKLLKAVDGLEHEVEYIQQGHIVALFLDRKAMSLTGFRAGFNGGDLLEKIRCIEIFYTDMFSALNYLHFIRGYIHNDIKPDNIVVHMNGTETRFQLIDFGLLTKIEDPSKTQPRFAGTQDYMAVTLYEKYSNIFYDWHCVLLSALYLFGRLDSYAQDPKQFYARGYNAFRGDFINYLVKIKHEDKNRLRITTEKQELELDSRIIKIANVMATNVWLYEATEKMVVHGSIDVKHYMDLLKFHIDSLNVPK